MLAVPSHHRNKTTLAVVWSVSHFKAYLYGHDVVVYSEHSAVKAVLEHPIPPANTRGGGSRKWSEKHPNCVYKAGTIMLTHCHGAPLNAEVEQVQVASVQTTDKSIRELLETCPAIPVTSRTSRSESSGILEQRKDSDLS